MAPPANDDPCGAIALPVNTTCITTLGNNTNATATVSNPATGCGQYTGGDVWFSFIAPTIGALTIRMTAGTLTNGAMAVYSAPNCSGTMSLIECDDADDRVILEWSTASESGVSHFELERSLDGEHFSRIGTVAAQGHSSATVRYQLLDEHPASGLNFYRLRSVDQDAGASTSHTVTAWMGSKSEAIRVVPNPTDQFANAMLHLPGDGSYAVRHIDGQGRVVGELSLQGLAGTNTIALDLKGCDAGAYQLLVTDPGGVLVARGRFVRH